MKKTIIVPIIAVIVLAIKLALGVDIGEDVQNQIADWTVAGASIIGVVYGIFKNHRTGGDENG